MAGLTKRGQIWLVDLDPGFGREIRKKRPALVISIPDIPKLTNRIIILPISSIVPKTVGIEMVLVDNAEGLNKKSVILPVFVRSIDQNRLIKKIGVISANKMAEVEQALRLIFGMSEKI